ncbi:33 kDa chaperonin (Heat shock protein 33) (HSP33) [plant metagenome]|uniref:33 kDa chaperonin (Heat shock protein 33) (HSP33) n=2 Tax=root TaxID=1 RepID=A0A1C3K8M9_9BURK|nr:Hsp33 family molecular chaperone HslO [Orrella dioscoreae]SBT27717.1 33 kDa chaperonin (Heat shock protein 33) (HSP33) [Orrella dioscoreae]SOE48495.1 33 kDa chaperonin (Heat shock protein 33) (HSP33) [Orrella dioscoreae]
MTDTLKKYLFEDRQVKVQIAELRDTWRHAQSHVQYPPTVRKLLGELVAAATLLAGNLKLDGSLVLQMHGDGPISLLVVECRGDLSLRATVKLREDHELPEDGTLQSLLNTHGKGRFIVVLDPRDKLPGQTAYQGVVPLEGETVAEVLEHYMLASEQLDTRLWLAADDAKATGVLLQRLPGEGGHGTDTQLASNDLDAWDRACHLAGTLKAEELLSTDSDTIIRRLFWEESLLAFEPLPVRWHCPCSKQKVADMLRMLGAKEVESILEERGKVDVTCDFCGKPYSFDPVDCAELFLGDPLKPAEDGSGTPTLH